MRRIFWTVALLGVLALSGAVVGYARSNVTWRGDKMAIAFLLTPRFEKWIMGARVVIDLRIENHGPGSVEFPNPMFTSASQPVFRLMRPAGTEEQFKPDQRAKAKRDVVPVTLDAGQTWIGELVLSDYSPLNEPGVYSLSAELNWQGAQASAPSTRFEIQAAKFGDLSASLSHSADGNANKELVLLQNGPRPDAALAGITEHDVRNAELNTLNFLRLGPLPPGTRHVHGPYANYATALDPLNWIVGSTPQSIHVGNSLNTHTLEIAPTRPILQVLTPLAVKGHRLIVLSLLDASSGVELAFAATTDAESRPARVVPQVIWRGERPAATAATLSPNTAGNACVVAMSRNTDNGVRVRLLKFDLAGKPMGETEQLIPGVKATDGIAVHWGNMKEIRVSVATEPAGNGNRVQLAELTFREDLTLEKPAAMTQVWTLTEPQAAAAIVYFEQTSGETRRASILRGQRGTSWVVDRSDRLKSLGASIPASSPVALIPGAEAWYAFFLTPTGVAAHSF
jgi:hypothetical protein